jgi:putative membrane protein
VSALQKDADGVWRGKAVKNGASVSVGLDFQGNVVSN